MKSNEPGAMESFIAGIIGGSIGKRHGIKYGNMARYQQILNEKLKRECEIKIQLMKGGLK